MTGRFHSMNGPCLTEYMICLPFSTCISSEGSKDEVVVQKESFHSRNSSWRMHSKQCRKVCSNSRDMFTTHTEVVLSWWSWKHSNRALKIEYSFYADPQPRRIICVPCISMQEGVLKHLPGRMKPNTCWDFSIPENITSKHSFPRRLWALSAMFTTYELNALRITFATLPYRSRIVAGTVL